MSEEVWIIGVDPPCPRCDLTRQRVERVANKSGGTLKIRHMIFSDPDARAFAESLGKETGTARHVSEKAGVTVAWDHVHAVVANPPSRPEDFEEIGGIARQWSPEMDEAIRPSQEKADSVDILMTPILVVDGVVKHHGSVPSLEQLRSWLT
jgi:hypothetical protein